jgi:hypothetical protein
VPSPDVFTVTIGDAADCVCGMAETMEIAFAVAVAERRRKGLL